MFLENSEIIAQDLATFLQIWIYYYIFSEVPLKSDKFSFKLKVQMANIAGKKFCKTRNVEKNTSINFENFGRLFSEMEVGAVQKSVNLVDLVKSFITSI